ncbi:MULTISPECIES: zinc ribbon domain-containing protein [Burkholderia]|uniref:zinc ribbon domain-containing protein n=1 Tax=Burkholderia TaxID=32008 RepID=UPI0007571E48|nr:MULTISPECIES: zinc ribbon domain-containing protein [Burkholderia]AOJ70585.1 adenylate cyclase [Burkholderia savannae]KVG47505.1 adenylate cyclase [Burkholderia sp. MSMB0265]KVG82460.1 adenylate cyclase [Burkholderia sp. MSMB2040]KVG92701.1 adenylate cyclase [Burkholderia sp. MSMB2041]KVG98559.1 adenylate cyclase [Burkholderia sp. MSMB2042]
MDWLKRIVGAGHHGNGGSRDHHGGGMGGDGRGHGSGHGSHGGHSWGRQDARRQDGWGRDGVSSRREAGLPVQSAACAKCGAINGADAKFCAQCGASQAPAACGACRALLDASARFCPQCGAAVSQARA